MKINDKKITEYSNNNKNYYKTKLKINLKMLKKYAPKTVHFIRE